MSAIAESLASLHAAVLADPADDLLRLVYADALCDRDDPGDAVRSEFIRVQCRLHQLRHGKGEQAFLQAHIDSLEKKELALLTPPNIAGWCGPSLAPLVIDHAADRILWGQADVVYPIEFHRGFVEAITCEAVDWLAHARAILAAHPVRQVRLMTTPAIVADFEPAEESDSLADTVDLYEYATVRWGGLPPLRFGSQLRLSQEQLRMSKAGNVLDLNRAWLHEEIQAKVDGLDYLDQWWPGITFALPERPHA